ncbi:hypothetical protein PRIPAC_83113 [Pristionchus pacificus]|uniref:Uncharacterized protein n=1 Tax=Pristionchus pacificus TaxID=54126 RepID=A0A2A6BMC9_PRIPA|nr:hypothetical protein PRIPAC_83113 [Pristionchus pacificus]|eukprot:PDM67055.1 hypothetical protein PRIPAC_48472 [Pristionchus pacificus]
MDGLEGKGRGTHIIPVLLVNDHCRVQYDPPGREEECASDDGCNPVPPPVPIDIAAARYLIDTTRHLN